MKNRLTDTIPPKLWRSLRNGVGRAIGDFGLIKDGDRELFEDIRKKGFLKVRVDGEIKGNVRAADGGTVHRIS